MPPSAHSGLLGDPQGQRPKPQMTSPRRVLLLPRLTGQLLRLLLRHEDSFVPDSLRATPYSRRQHECISADNESEARMRAHFESPPSELVLWRASPNEIDRSVTFARSALGVRRVFASLSLIYRCSFSNCFLTCFFSLRTSLR